MPLKYAKTVFASFGFVEASDPAIAMFYLLYSPQLVSIVIAKRKHSAD